MTNPRRNVIISTIALSIVALSWGTSYAIIKDELNNIGPFTLMTLRFGLSTILLSVLFIKRLTRVTKKDIYHGSVIGLFMFLSFLSLITGIKYTTASKQSFLVGSYVLIVPFLSWMINKKRLSPYSMAGAVLATAGIGLLTMHGSFYINKGDLISILCALSFACHMISIEHFSKDSDPIISTIIQFAVTSLAFIILMGTFESFNCKMSQSTVGAVLYLVIVTTVIAFVVQNIAQKYISSSNTSIILTLESAFGGIFAVLYLHENMNLQMIIGCIVIFIGILTGQTQLKFLRFIKKGMPE